MFLSTAKIQRAWRRYASNKKYVQLRRTMADFLTDRKERRRDSIYRPYIGDYLKLNETALYAPLRDMISSFEASGAESDSDSEDDEKEDDKAKKRKAKKRAAKAKAAATPAGAPDRRFRSAAGDAMKSLPVLFSDRVTKFVGAGAGSASVGSGDDASMEERLLVVTEQAMYFFSHLTPLGGGAAASGDGKVEKKKKKKKDKLEEAAPAAAAATPAVISSDPVDLFMLRRRVPIAQLKSISLSRLADTFIVLHANEDCHFASFCIFLCC